MNNPYSSETGCCPLFDPATLDQKELHWDNKLFIKDKVFCLFNFPLNFGGAMVRCIQKIDACKAYTPEPPLVLSDHVSPFRMDLYLEVPHEVPGIENTRLSGEFLCKVYEGPYKNIGKWIKDMAQWVGTKGKTIRRQLFYYTCCPKCAKHYGKNYIVLIAQTK